MSVRLSTSLPRACSGLMLPRRTDNLPGDGLHTLHGRQLREVLVPFGHQTLSPNRSPALSTLPWGVTLTFRWFQISVNDSFVVRASSCRRHLACAVECGFNRQGTAQHFPLDQFHNQTVRRPDSSSP